MPEFRVPEFTLEDRIQVALELSNPERKWGIVSELAERYGVSRTLLYRIRDCAAEVLADALTPGKPGPAEREETLTVDGLFIKKTISILPFMKGTVRDIQLGLQLIFGVYRSVGYIHKTLSEAGKKAEETNLAISIPLPILGEADEIFQGRKPCLTLVDGRSFLVLNLTPADCRDATTWGTVYLDLVERGVKFHDLGCDGGTGLRAGVKEAELAIPLRPDLFHLLQDAHKLSQRLESEAFKAIKEAERARRAAMEERSPVRRRGPRLKIKTPLPQAEVKEAQAIELFDVWYWLVSEIRQALEPISPDCELVSAADARATLETAIELIESIGRSDLSKFAKSLRKKLNELLSPLEWLEQNLAPVFKDLDAESRRFILWARENRKALNFNLETDVPEALSAAARNAWEILELFHRSSSLAESLHSWLRPYLQIHRGMPGWLLPILQMFWNHHRFERGKRAGSSPLQLAGVEDAPSLKEAFAQLFEPDACPQPAQ